MPGSVSSIHLCCIYKRGLYPAVSKLLSMEISLNDLSGNFLSSLFLGVRFLEHLLFGCQLPGTIFHFVICPSHFSFLYQFVSLARFFFQIFLFLLRHYLLISIRILITGFLERSVLILALYYFFSISCFRNHLSFYSR